MKSSQNRILTPPVLIEPIPNHPDVSLQLIIWANRFHDILPANVGLLKRGVLCEGREVSSLKGLLRAVTDLWTKGMGALPPKIRLITFLSKILKQLFPDNSVEIPDKINEVARTLKDFSAY